MVQKIRCVKSDWTNPLSSAQDGEGNSVHVQVKDNGNSTYACTYTPRKPVKHTVMVSWGDVHIPESPFRVSMHSHTLSLSLWHAGIVFSSHWEVSWVLVFVPTDEYRSWISERAVIQTRWRSLTLEWQRRASKPSRQHTSLLTAQSLVKVKLHKTVCVRVKSANIWSCQRNIPNMFINRYYRETYLTHLLFEAKNDWRALPAKVTC